MGESLMTDDIGRGIHNYFSKKTLDTVEINDNEYLQVAHDQETDSYSVLHRENGRYSQPVQITGGYENERDAQQILVAGEDGGFPQVREILNGGTE